MKVSHDLQDNLPRVLERIATAGDSKADFALFPEMSLSGYHGRFSQAKVEAALGEIARACRRARVCALVGTGWRDRTGVRIQVRVIDKRGTPVGAHSKMVPTGGDRRFCRPGRRLRLFEVSGLRFGVLICNDMWVTPGAGLYPDPRLCERLGRRGAALVFHAINSGGSPQYIPYHESNLSLRARASGLHIATANATLTRRGVNARSGVVGPDGSWLVSVPRRGEHFYVHDVSIQRAKAKAR